MYWGGDVTIAATLNDGRCRIVVTTDNGEGFDPAIADRLFERFYRGDSSRASNGAGSGIGLTIAKAIIEAHHGQLQGHSHGPAPERRSRSSCRSCLAGTP